MRSPAQTQQAPIAYYITVHHKFSQFLWLFQAIYTRGDVFVVNVDGTADARLQDDVRSLVQELPNVRLLRPRSMVWGGWSQVAAERDAIALLLASRTEWRYLINLSGQDYPLKSIETIRSTLSGAWPNSFIRAWSFDRIRESEPDDWHLKRRLALAVGGRARHTKLPAPRDPWLDTDFKGSQWHMLARPFCEWSSHAWLAHRIAGSVRYRICPDELYFQALIMNSPFKELRIDDPLREVIWPGPKVLTMGDLPRLSSSDALFGRKFDEDVDAEVLAHLARANGYATHAMA